MKATSSSMRQRIKRASEELGIPETTLKYRQRYGIPWDAPYSPRDNDAKERRKWARMLGLRTYASKPCRVCDSTFRYVSSNRCITCSHAAVTRSRKGTE